MSVPRPSPQELEAAVQQWMEASVDGDYFAVTFDSPNGQQLKGYVYPFYDGPIGSGSARLPLVTNEYSSDFARQCGEFNRVRLKSTLANTILQQVGLPLLGLYGNTFIDFGGIYDGSEIILNRELHVGNRYQYTNLREMAAAAMATANGMKADLGRSGFMITITPFNPKSK